MRTVYRLPSLAAAAILVMVATALLASVKTDYNHSADFSKYKICSKVKVKAGNSLRHDRGQRG